MERESYKLTMKELTLTNTKLTAKVDDEDFERCLPFPWFLNRRGYVVYSPDSGKHYVWLHRFIIGSLDNYLIDHINRDKTDNQRSNLRFVTPSQNAQNRKLNNDNSSGFRGVAWNFHHQKFQAYIRVQGKQKHLGYFKTKEEAAVEYNKAALANFGECAALNFREEG